MAPQRIIQDSDDSDSGFSEPATSIDPLQGCSPPHPTTAADRRPGQPDDTQMPSDPDKHSSLSRSDTSLGVKRLQENRGRDFVGGYSDTFYKLLVGGCISAKHFFPLF